MSPRTSSQQKWILVSIALTDAYTDYIWSRQAMQCTTAMFDFYKYKAGVFLKWVEGQSVTSPEQVDARLVRQYLAGLTRQGKADKTFMLTLARYGRSFAFGMQNTICLRP